MITKNFKFIFLVPFSFALGCATVKPIIVESTPQGAKVISVNGEVLGETPVTFSEDQMNRMTQGDMLSFKVQRPGHLPREMVIPRDGLERVNVKLVKMDDNFFKRAWMQEFQLESNVFARELLEIHGLILNRRFDPAEKRLEAFLENYPTVAAGWVLRANIATLKNNQAEAQKSLLRAQTLDPLDPVIARLLKQIATRTGASDKAEKPTLNAQKAQPGKPQTAQIPAKPTQQKGAKQ